MTEQEYNKFKEKNLRIEKYEKLSSKIQGCEEFKDLILIAHCMEIRLPEFHKFCTIKFDTLLGLKLKDHVVNHLNDRIQKHKDDIKKI